MASGMLGAAMASGFGQGLANASSTAMQLVGTSMLQRERADMENRRLALMESYATAREQRGYQHQDETLAKTQEFQRGLQQEKIGSEITLRAQEREDQSREKAADRALSREEHAAADATTRRGQDITKEHGKDVLAATISHNKATEAHQKVLETMYRDHYKDQRDKVEKFYNDEKGAFWALTESGVNKPIINPNTGQQVIGEKQLTDSAKELAKLHIARGEAYLKIANEPTASADERAKNLQLSNDAYTQAASYLGEKPVKSSGSVQIKDRFASPGGSGALDAKPSSEPPAPKPRPDKIVPSTPSPSPSAGPTDALSFGFEKAKEGVGMLAQKAQDALMPQSTASPGPIVKESKEQALAAVTRGSASPETVLAEKRQEAEQRAAAVQPKSLMESTGLLSQANANVPPKVSPKREPPKVTPQSTQTSYATLLESVPAEKREYVKAQIQEAMDNLKSGKITEEQFRSSILLAWTSVPGSPDQWRVQANTLAQGLLAELRGAK